MLGGPNPPSNRGKPPFFLSRGFPHRLPTGFSRGQFLGDQDGALGIPPPERGGAGPRGPSPFSPGRPLSLPPGGRSLGRDLVPPRQTLRVKKTPPMWGGLSPTRGPAPGCPGPGRNLAKPLEPEHPSPLRRGLGGRVWGPGGPPPGVWGGGFFPLTFSFLFFIFKRFQFQNFFRFSFFKILG